MGTHPLLRHISFRMSGSAFGLFFYKGHYCTRDPPQVNKPLLLLFFLLILFIVNDIDTSRSTSDINRTIFAILQVRCIIS